MRYVPNVHGFFLLLALCGSFAACGTSAQNRVGETSLQEACQAPLDQCKQNCRQEPDGAAQNACFTRCLQQHQACQASQ